MDHLTVHVTVFKIIRTLEHILVQLQSYHVRTDVQSNCQKKKKKHQKKSYREQMGDSR